MIRFTSADLEQAHATWGCNCGPSALAAICGLTLDEVRVHFVDWPGYTNPTAMYRALGLVRAAAGVRWRKLYDAARPDARGTASWPKYGLARIQWEGPWTQPGVPMRARYRQTHWVGAWTTTERGIGVWDCNAIGNGTGWCSLADWSAVLVPALAAEIKRATGGWHITHAIEVSK